MASFLILLFAGVIFFLIKIFEFISDALTISEKKQEFERERKQKYGARITDKTKKLFDRNFDLIEEFSKRIDSDSYGHYYLENKVRDCINEIALAEGVMSVRPSSSYLSKWKTSAPADWKELADQTLNFFQKVIKANKAFQTEISDLKLKLQRLYFDFSNSKTVKELRQHHGDGSVLVSDISKILTPNFEAWSTREMALVENINKLEEFPYLQSSRYDLDVEQLNKDISVFNEEAKRNYFLCNENAQFFKKILNGYKNFKKDEVIQRIAFIINSIDLPASLPKFWDIDFDPDQAIAIVEIGLPDVVHDQIFKEVSLKHGVSVKALSQKEAKEIVPKIHPAIVLRVAYEIFRNDEQKIIKLLVINGWVDVDDPHTGKKTRIYTASLVVERDQIDDLNLSKLDPLAAFLNLKGKSAGKLIDIIPVTPTMSLDKKDKRFIATKEVINILGKETNLAAMDWRDFESLIAELFQKEFADKGAEVKVTQASRDRGVDAVVFDPDPIKGGKYIIQAKRYTNTVDVSAVRDLCAVVKKEGATKGILVTTSSYGADAYTFAQNEPITLLNGAELLGLLEKHGYKFRINLAEARKLNII